MKKISALALLGCLSYAGSGFAWSWQLDIVNNLDTPLNYKFNQKNSGNAWAEDGTKNSGSVRPNDHVQVKMTTGGTFNKTTDGILTLTNSNGLRCNLRYYQQVVYQAHNLSTWRLDGNQNSPECNELFISSTDASKDGWNPVKLIFNSVKFPRLTKGQTECSGIENCVVVNPPKYNTNWAVENIHRQTHIADYEPLNAGQVLGSHNSLVSRIYTSSSTMTNMSYSDPNHYISMTNQLDLGIRQFELDMLDDGNFKICHYSSDDGLLSNFAKLFVCDGNSSFESTLVELNNWLNRNPNELIYVYLDDSEEVWNQSRLTRFNAILSRTLGSKTLTKHELQNDTLPVHQLTRDEIVHKYKKNVIMYMHNKDKYFSSSPFLFSKVTGNTNTLLHEDRNVSDFSRLVQSCGIDKSCLTKELFPNDQLHLGLTAIREDRTHLQQQKGSIQNTSVYITHDKLKDAVKYPINIIAFDKLSLNDSRLLNAIWSFKFPYPLNSSEGGSDLSYIDPITGRFANKSLSNTTTDILCFNKKNAEWYVVRSDLNPTQVSSYDFTQNAHKLCYESKNGIFATPVNGHQLDNIVKLGVIQNPTIINYIKNAQNDWVPNEKQSIL